MNALRLEDFDRFFQAMHPGNVPFHWQRKLMQRVANEGWPRSLNLPMAAGKTAVLDIAVFHMALDAERPPAERRAPRRCFFIIDRRIIVDEAYERALHLRNRLREAHDGVLRTVADRLRHLAGGQLPLATAILRGGIYREGAWVRNPAQPLLVISTVDHVGSRLLFRGYGVSEYVRPIHAGLVGNDALLILDEAHQSEPFWQTLTALERYRGWQERAAVPDRFAVAAMSATLGTEAEFELPPEDRDPQQGLELPRRLRAHKLMRLELVPVERGEHARDRLAAACVKQAQRLVAQDPTVRVVGIVVNRVETARKVFALLRSLGPEGDADGDVDRVLLIGRSRPAERDDLIERYKARMMAGRERREGDRPLFVVATQCIEVGANLDFDALVTECASLAALRQRCGRLDRLGRLGTARGVILVSSDQVGPRATTDPIYGEALSNTWAWLVQMAERSAVGSAPPGKRTPRTNAKQPREVDFGVEWLPLPEEEQLKRLLVPQREAPVLLPAHLDAWVQTSPMPTAEPDIALWLHGPDSGPADVQVVWRADLDEHVLAISDRAQEIVAACPPSSAEVMPVPLYAVRAWLRGELAEIADVEGTLAQEEPAPRQPGRMALMALRWRGEASEIIDASRLRPGDTLIVPATYGGADAYGWNPASKIPVSDLGDRAHLEQRARPLLRLHRAVLQSWLTPPPEGGEHPLIASLAALDPTAEANPREVIRSWLELLREAEDTPTWAHNAATAMLPGNFRVFASPAAPVLVATKRVEPSRDESTDVTTDDDSSCFTTHVSLEEHSAGVRDQAHSDAQRCGLPPAVCDDLGLTGWEHDVGKADPRCQLWLYGGDRVALEGAGTLLAKSGLSRHQMAVRRARERSGYLTGTRHELLSVALIEGCTALRTAAHDWELVLHLVASHHGYCRPLPPVGPDLQPVLVRLRHGSDELSATSVHGLERLDSGIADRFWTLVARYGWYGLAYLETILRLADWRRSELEMP